MAPFNNELNDKSPEYWLEQGKKYLEEGNDIEAEKAFERALACARDKASIRMSIGLAYYIRGNLRYNQHNYEEVEEDYTKAIERCEKAVNQDLNNAEYQHLLIAVYYDRGVLRHNQHKYEEAEKDYTKVIECREKLVNQQPDNTAYQYWLGVAYNNRGVLRKNQGRYEEAEKDFTKAIEHCEKAVNQDLNNAEYQYLLGAAYNNRGVLHKDQGRYEEAEKDYTKAIEHREKAVNQQPDDAEYQYWLGAAYYNRGVLRKDQHRYEEVEKDYTKAIEHYEKAVNQQPDNAEYQYWLGSAYNNRGVCLIKNFPSLQIINNIYQASSDFTKGFEILSKQPQTMKTADMYINEAEKFNSIAKEIHLAERMIQNIKLDYSLDYFEKARKIQEEHYHCEKIALTCLFEARKLLSENGDTDRLKKSLKEGKEYAVKSESMDILCEILSCEGMLKEKLRNFNEAKNCYRQAINYWALHNRDLGIGDVADKGGIYEVYENLVTLLLKTNNREEIRDSLKYLEMSKARSLNEWIGKAKINFDIQDHQDEQNFQLLERLLKRINGIREKLSSSVQENRSELVEEMAKYKREYKEVSINLSERYPKFAFFNKMPSISVDEIKQILKEGEILIEFGYSAKKIYYWIITKEQTLFNAIDSNLDIDNETERMQGLINGYLVASDDVRKQINEDFVELLSKFYDSIWKPIEDDLQKNGLGNKNIFIVPYRQMHNLPFHAFYNEKEEKYLYELRNIIYLPSAYLLFYLRNHRQVDLIQQNQIVGFAKDGYKNKKYRQLDMESIVDVFEAIAPNNIERYLGADATKGALEQVARRGIKDIVFIGCHGEISEGDVERSGIIISSCDGGDELLNMPEIINLNLDGRMLILGACSTGSAGIRQVSGDSIEGVYLTFFGAGFRLILAPIWQTLDSLVKELLRLLVVRLKDNVNLLEAFRKALTELRNLEEIEYRGERFTGKPFKSPIFWSSLRLMGDFRVIFNGRN